MFTKAIMKALTKIVRWVYRITNIIVRLDPTILAVLIVILAQAHLGLAQGTALALIVSNLFVSTVLAHLVLQGEARILKFVEAFIIVMGVSTSIFVVAALVITVLFPTAENLAFLPSLPMKLAQLAVSMAPLMALVVFIPFVNNLFSDKGGKA